MAYVVPLALRQPAHRPGRYALLAAGVALAVGLLVAGSAVVAAVAARTVGTTLAGLEPTDRALTVAYGGAQDPARQASDDALVRGGLASLTPEPARQELLFGTLSDGHGTTYRLAALDDLGTAVHLTSGRLPAPCTPARCEVLQTGTGALPRLDPSLGVVVVGTAVRSDPLALAGTFDPGGGVVLVGDGVAAAERLRSLTLFPRGAGWVAEVDPATVAAAGVPAYAAFVADVSDRLTGAGRSFVLSGPSDALVAADDRARVSQSRLTLLTSTTAVLVLGLVVVAAAGLRREHAALVRVVERRGAGPGATALLTTTVVGTTVALGAVVGLLLGAVAAAAVGAAAAYPPAPLGSLVVGALLPTALAVAAATVLGAATLRWPASRAGAARATAAVVAAASVGVAVLAAGRGGVGTSAAGSGDPLLAALPVLVLVAGGLLAGLAWAPLARALSRRLPDRAVTLRLALESGLRAALATATTVGFVAAAIGAVVFAGSYRATLLAGDDDQAAYQVPTAARLSPGRDSVSALEVLARDGTPAGTVAYAVTRATASVRGAATGDVTAAALLGVDPAVLPLLDRWDRTTGGDDPTRAATLIAAPVPTTGAAVPDAATTIGIPVLAEHGESRYVDVRAWVRAPDGREESVLLTRQGAELAGPLPVLGDGRTLVALTLSEDPDHAARREHRVGEGTTAAPIQSAALLLGPARVEGTVVPWDGWAVPGSASTTTDAGLALTYRLAGATTVVRPPGSRPALRALVDPATAAATPGDLLTVSVDGMPLRVAVAGTLPRFPTTTGRFVVLDRGALVDALDDVAPGSGAPREVWLTGSDAAVRAMATGSLEVQRQADLRDSLAADPVGQGAVVLLAAGALLALLLAGASSVLLVVVARRDEDGELLVLEADGCGPGTLRRTVLLRAVQTVVPGAVGGLLVGAALAGTTVTLLAVSATGSEPVPPLTAALGAPAVVAVVVVALIVTLAAAALVAGGTARGPWPGRPEEELA